MSDEITTLATRACSTCRRQKRRCTKEIPKCSLCRKHGKDCEYDMRGSSAIDSEEPLQEVPCGQSSDRPYSLTSADSVPSASNPVRVTVPVPSQTVFPALFFLDSSYFQLRNKVLERQHLSLPQELLGRLSGLPQMRYDVDVFFNSVHCFFPIVSKLRLYQELSNSPIVLNADTALLLVAIQLHTQPVDKTESSYRDLYTVAKDCLSYVEGSNILSVRLLQATILIALYEISNAIYPAAYLRVGHCARLGHALGIHNRKRALQMLCPPKTATESEERRRVWWAVIILDRYVNLGSKGRPFACDDARPDDYLPIEEKHWDQGELTPVQPLAISSSTTLQAPPFARTCQAAHLLSRILRHISDDDIDAEFQFEEAIQLHRTAQALCSATLHESDELFHRTSDPTACIPLCTAMGLCFSSQLTLYDKYCCTENSEAKQMGSPNLLEMQRIAISGIKEVSNAVFQFSKRVRVASELGGMLRISPLICDSLYQSAATYLWCFQESGNEDCLPPVKGIQDVLDIMGTRWKSPRYYTKQAY
ncbi:hypothetical protein DER46DRAFT_650711 [Fusarium sp. MPI-SDFR-AT-0072]|nr:hypothetical protein DER46DRAFT_650711 [Fusarium sp. MPI-SDFR-AT-0072]